VPAWTEISAALRSFEGAASRAFRRKVKSTLFPKKRDGAPYNASGVVQVGPRQFVFVDNRDPTALFEFVLDADGARVDRRPLLGLGPGQLGDPEGLTRIDLNGETFLVAASSLCLTGGKVNDGLVRVRYTPGGDLHAEAMNGFRSWLLSHDHALDEAATLEPDKGGLNIEGLAWDPGTNALLLGQRGPAEAGRIAMIQVAVDMRATAWTTAALGTPSFLSARIPQSSGRQGIRDISYDDQTGDFLILLGRSRSGDDAPFQLCAWTRGSDDVRLTGVKFEKNMKPEGVTTVSGGKRKIVVVDDAGGYAVVKLRHSDQ
jgi:uncharacterized protein DUF3616